MNTNNLPFWAVIVLTIVFNGLYAALGSFHALIDPQTVIMLNVILGYAANQLHITLVSNAVASAKAPVVIQTPVNNAQVVNTEVNPQG